MTPVLRPEGWTPRPGSRVRILPDPKAAADEPLPPAGVWYVIDRAPEPTHWWLWAHDDEAKAWTAASPSNAGWPAASRCPLAGWSRPRSLTQRDRRWRCRHGRHGQCPFGHWLSDRSGPP
jgi:hypothetical protein